ncbi:MAG: NAD(P)H-binding protein [Hyphomicrobiales bacterium]|nr:NAD(P)H-binding protein [Hyphomicrobiales bacterium]MCP5370890.1 NAD(P)H-binding protein [Hyphomicrobiales bacterium]
MASMASKNVILTGATGMIGGLVLDACLARDDVAAVTSILRRPSGRAHPRLTEVVHGDFTDFSAIAAHFAGQDICFFCLGVYTGQVDTAQFRRITIDVTRAFAGALEHGSPGAAFCFLSGQGADPSGRSKVLFAQAKGVAENDLTARPFRTHIFRPGYIYPVTPRAEPNLFYRLARPLYPALSRVWPNLGLTSADLAAAMVAAGFDGCDLTVLENADIRRLAAAVAQTVAQTVP